MTAYLKQLSTLDCTVLKGKITFFKEYNFRHNSLDCITTSFGVASCTLTYGKTLRRMLSHVTHQKPHVFFSFQIFIFK